MASVELKVKSGLKTILDDLESLRAKAEEVSASLKETGDETSKTIKKNTKETETFFGNLRTFGRRVSDQLKRDFKALVSVESLGAGLKISSQFKDSIAETVQLSDSIRKLGPVFGMAEREFVSFQKTLTSGLGEIGLSSDVASRTLEGLSQTQVRGQGNLAAYSIASGQLASISSEQGQEGQIAEGLARVIQARGGDVNDKKQMEALAESLRRVFITTGQGPTKALQDMENLFASMPQDLRKSITSSGLANLAAAQATGGPGATKFLEEMLGKSPIARMAFEAQGGKGVFTDQGIDIDKFKTFAQSIMGRVGGDPRLAAQTLGLSEEAAEGFVRLAESLDRVKAAQDKIQKATGSLNETYRQSMGLGESFRANINRIKSFFAEPLATITQGATGILGSASQSDIGAGAVVAGGGLLAALLTGGGLRGVGKGLLGTVAKGAIAEEITGQKTIPVYVTNAAEIGIGSALGGKGSALGTVGKVLGGVGIAAGGAYLAGEGMEYVRENTGYSAQSELGLAEAIGGEAGGKMYESLYNLLVTMNNKLLGTNLQPLQKVKVEFNTPQLKETKQPTRGASN